MASLTSLAERLSPGSVLTSPDERERRTRDWSPLAMLRAARGDPPALPAAVVVPSSTADVAALLAWASETRTPVVPRGGGSGVCGGAVPPEGAVVLDLSAMDRVLEIDASAGTVHVEAGVRGDRLEEALAGHGLTSGHYPQSIAISTVGGWIAAASAGQASTGYGGIEHVLLGCTAVLADGSVLRLRPVPRSAAGPDIRRLLVGSEGTLAVVTEAWLACFPRPSRFGWEAFRFATFEDCMGGVRDVERSRAGAAVLRGYDEVDAALALRAEGGGAVAIAGMSADLPGLEERHAAVRAAAAASGGEMLGPEIGERWWERRNDAVATYERIMGPSRAFGPGVVVDTMEVAASWRALPPLYRAVRGALLGHAEGVACHLSHVYPAGSSLYFTFLVRGGDDRDVEDRYLAAWEAATAACADAGGTIAHHHGVGRLKAPFLARDLGDEGVEVLRRVKAALDPGGILNPGALLP